MSLEDRERIDTELREVKARDRNQGDFIQERGDENIQAKMAIILSITIFMCALHPEHYIILSALAHSPVLGRAYALLATGAEIYYVNKIILDGIATSEGN